MHREPIPKKNFVIDTRTIISVISQPTKQQSMSIISVRRIIIIDFELEIEALL